MGKGLQNSKIAITGKNGQLAKEFEKILTEKGINFYSFDKKELDITDANTVFSTLEKIKPDFLINCAAYNLVDKAEEEREKAFEVNAKGVENLAVWCAKNNCKLIHFGTDYVFDGKKKLPFTETDKPNPLNYYGKTKLEGEKKIKEILQDYLIFRVSWLYGKGKSNFIFKFQNWAKGRDELHIAEDEVSVPTWTKTVAETTLLALENNLQGLYHLCNSGYASRYEYAKEIADLLSLNIKIIPAKMSMFNLKAKRPNFSAMDNSLLAKTLNIEIPEWKKDLKKFLKEIE